MAEISFHIQDVQENEILKQESSPNNLLDLNNSMLPHLNLTIPMQSISTNNNTTKKDLDAMNENIYPYPDLDEIPEIKMPKNKKFEESKKMFII